MKTQTPLNRQLLYLMLIFSGAGLGASKTPCEIIVSYVIIQLVLCWAEYLHGKEQQEC